MDSYNRSAGILPALQSVSGKAGETPALQDGFHIRNRGYLPHFEQQGSSYFVTFRLADSLPKEILEKYKLELANGIRSPGILPASSDKPVGAGETPALQAKTQYQQKVQRFLDNGAGSCYLKIPEIANLVKNALFHFDKVKYNLYTWCIMPNHIHVLFRPFKQEKLQNIIHSWKSFTAKESNKFLNRQGAFWQEEYYDHLVRNEREFLRIQEYILSNPVSTGRENYEWVGFGDIFAESDS